MTHILITGFGPFPGAPRNPTMHLARHLSRLRRPRLAGVQRPHRLLETTWAMLDAIPALIHDVAPDAVLMFGLAGRRRAITPEARARNRASVLRIDAAGGLPAGPVLEPGPHAARTGTIDAVRMTAAMRRADLSAAVSRDAGDYLCNALFWRMLGTGIPCIFVHVPRPVRMTLPKGPMRRSRPTMRQLERAAEIALIQVVARIHAVARIH
jgi:pyroglutamyl-peptidase